MTDFLLFLNLPCHMQVSFQATAKIFKTLTEVRKISWNRGILLGKETYLSFLTLA